MGKKIAFLIIISILIIGLNIFAMPESVSASDIQPVVVINPGHGYYEPGACHSGITELSLNNSLSIKIYNVLIKAGYDVYFAQNFAGNPAPNKTLASGTIYTWNLSPKYDPEEGTPLSTLINKLDPDLVITVHHNSSASQAINGYELYAYGRQGSAYTSSTGALSTKSIYFANVLNQEFSALTHVGSRGVQVTYKHQFHQYVTSPTLLIEAGFMSNPSELTKLCNASNQQKMANQVRDAVNRFFAQYPVENEQEPEIENISLYPVAGNAGEIYTTTIVTSDNVTKIRFYTDTSDSIHTYHSTITLASSGVTVINNKDGTKTWTINKTIGKTGDRTFSYKAGNGSSWTGYSTVEFSVLEVTGKLSEISSVVMNPVSGYSGEIFTAEIVTFSDVTQLDFYSDGKTPFEYKYSLTGSSDGVTIITEGESSTWTVETEVGRLGNRIFSYKAFNGSS
jgi:N-acetylmuramoyl-L-alanine amidase